MYFSLAPFFISNFTGISHLSHGEKILMIKSDFPNAQIDRVGFITVGSVNVLVGAPKKELATLSVERITYAIEYNFFDGKNQHNLFLPEKISTPFKVYHSNEIWQRCHYTTPLNCELEQSNCLVNWSLSKLQINVKEYQFVYNCIGWALGIEVWLDPVQREDGLLDISNFSDLKKVTQNFITDTKNTYRKLENLHFMKIDIIENIEEIVCGNVSSKEINREGVVAFYFNNFGMTHAARFVKTFDGQEVNSWTSKLGHNIMISHELEDLSGASSIYGHNLCYGMPKSMLDNILETEL